MLKKIWERLKADYTPKSVEVLRKGYSLALFKRDCISGLTVSIVSLPLATALAIARGLNRHSYSPIQFSAVFRRG